MKKGAIWPWSLMVFFAGLIGLYVYLFRVAGDPSALVVEPDYYQKGLHYDSTLAQARRNIALGWQLVPALTPLPGGEAELRVALKDRSGAALDSATVFVIATHNLLADRPDSATLARRGAGEYEARLAMPRAGMWELRFDVVRGATRFTDDERVDLSAAGQ